jgi:hypothetical protein
VTDIVNSHTVLGPMFIAESVPIADRSTEPLALFLYFALYEPRYAALK